MDQKSPKPPKLAKMAAERVGGRRRTIESSCKEGEIRGELNNWIIELKAEGKEPEH